LDKSDTLAYKTVAKVTAVKSFVAMALGGIQSNFLKPFLSKSCLSLVAEVTNTNGYVG
jgi:hypothetical protein